MPNLKLVLSFFVCLIMMGIPNVTNSRTVMMGVMNKKCPEGYVLVPPDPNYGSQPNYFCVAKYEMKNDGGVAVSKAPGIPWVNIQRGIDESTSNSAIKACRDLGNRYSLISNEQWQIIARNIANVPINWHSSTVGTRLSVGVVNVTSSSHLKAADPTNADLCFQAGSSCTWGAWSEYRRVHRLSNNEDVWDMGGNAREWVSTDRYVQYNSAQDPYISVSYINNLEFGLESSFSCAFPSSNPFCLLGKAVHNTDTLMSKPAFLRGSGYGSTIYDYGLFSTNTNHYTNELKDNWGFRCVYRIEN